MVFRVSQITGAPEFETLPVAKITRYPLEKRDYKPFAQCCICMGSEELCLRMWAFEVNTCPASELRAVLYLFPDAPEKALHIQINPPETATLENDLSIWVEEAGEKIPVKGRSHPHNGEDLQGFYWGSDLFIPLDSFEDTVARRVGETFRGNFYKIRTGERFEHYGSFAPADFTANPFGRESMADFQIVSY